MSYVIYVNEKSPYTGKVTPDLVGNLHESYQSALDELHGIAREWHVTTLEPGASEFRVTEEDVADYRYWIGVWDARV